MDRADVKISFGGSYHVMRGASKESGDHKGLSEK